MKCKSRWCDLESGHSGRCQRVVNTDSVVVNSGPVEPSIQVVQPHAKAAGEADGGERPARQTKWQRDNRERYNKRMREYMKKRRRGFIGIAYG